MYRYYLYICIIHTYIDRCVHTLSHWRGLEEGGLEEERLQLRFVRFVRCSKLREAVTRVTGRDLLLEQPAHFLSLLSLFSLSS